MQIRGKHMLHAILIVSIYFFCLIAVDALRVGVAPFPEPDRFTMMLAIVEEMHLRGHDVTIYVPGSFMNECHKVAGCECISIGMYNEAYTKKNEPGAIFSDLIISFSGDHPQKNFNNFFASAFKMTLEKNLLLPDVIMVDIETWGADSVARSLQIPTVFLWSSRHWPAQMNPSFPSYRNGLGPRMSEVERLKNYFFQRLNHFVTRLRNTKFDNSYESFETLLYGRHIVAPFVFGLDMSQPFCPNIHSVGFLIPRSREMTSMNSSLMSWMNGCTEGILYINLGSISHFSAKWTKGLYESIDNFTKKGLMCVLWEVPDNWRPPLMGKKNDVRFRLSPFFPFSRLSILHHKNTKIFLTKCGGISVYEAVESGVPILGLGFFPNEMEMCAMAQYAGIGVALDKLALNSSQFINEVTKLKNNPKILGNLMKIKRMGYVMGGSRKAADVVEFVASLDNDSGDFFCLFAQLPFIERYDLDVFFILSGIVSVIILLTINIVCCRKSIEETHKKQN
ncbi:UDP-glucoronosyl and UDP-glucosyl transferase, putative [Trypanosoma cruzi marinkellei]|uniref:UDP-glucoronosyl and UDP-glucosyl transferase, putative n=1 Tax=Trypanosoma cruzi marinkellei TaxID=85056 RepID=K2MX16_TRYCR|nr:UDP-glucoronosyl and UDP-glucosyl transferase, putative [Trypanosoma cruzi marinkellei]